MKRRVLLVEDESNVRTVVTRLLAQDELQVVESNNGAEALTLFARDRFDLVITDLKIPFLQGNELAVRIRNLAPQQPILMMTAYGEKPGRNNPVNAVLQKPFDSARLRQAVTELLNTTP